MLGPKQEEQAALFYEFSLEGHVPQDHLLRSIDRFVDLCSIRAHLADYHASKGTWLATSYGSGSDFGGAQGGGNG